MEIAIFEAKDVAGQVKRANLAATVGQELMTPNCTFNHLIDIVCRLSLPEYFGVPPVLKFA